MLVKKSEYNKLHEELESKRHIVDQLEAYLEDYEYENQKLKEQLSQYENGITTTDSEQTSASFFVSNDLESVKPLTTVSPNIINKLVEAGYLASNKTGDDFSLNLAIMLVVSEAVEQIVFSFEQDVEDTEEDDDLDPHFGEDLQ